MDSDPRIDQFLEAATAGLKDDPELRLDVRAELASHLEAHLEEAGASERGAALGEALKAVGTPVELAAQFASANRSRMTRRARLRRAIRFLLVPAAVLTAFLVAIPYPAKVITAMGQLSGGTESPGLDALAAGGWFQRALTAFPARLSARDRLVLEGDRTRPHQAQQQRAIWEAVPDSRTFAGNYVTCLAQGIAHLGATDAERLARLAEELNQVRAIDPGNARYDYVAAGHKFRVAAEIQSEETGEKGPDGKMKYRDRLLIKDRQLLDEAMADYRDGLKQPFLRRYCGDMLRERLTILGGPTNQLELVRQIAISAAVLLPDLATYRQLAKAAFLYGELLIREGRGTEAEAYLDSWRALALQITDDCFCLIDALVVSAILKTAESEVARVYRENGLATKADATAADAARIAAPVQRWRDQQRTPPPGYAEQEKAMARSAGTLARVLLPALGELPPAEHFTASRWVEYVLAETAVAGLVVLLLLTAMLGAGLLALRWRLQPGAASAPILLMPDARETGRVLLAGVLLPVLGYYVYSRWLPLSRREFALSYAWPMLAIEVLVLVTVIIQVTVGRSLAVVRGRCQVLGVQCPQHSPRWDFSWRVAGWSVAGLGGLGLLAAAFAPPVEGGTFCPWLMALAALLAVLLVVIGFRGVVRAWRAVFAEARHGLYYGTVARSVLPFFAAATIALGLATRPYLRWQEANLVRNDRLMSICPDRPAFTRIEMELTYRLRDALRAAARNDKPDK